MFVASFIAIGYGLMATGSSRAQMPSAPGLQANDKITWVYQRQADETGQPLLRLAFRRAGPRSPTGFIRLQVGALTGTIARAAVRDTELHAFFADGTHFRFMPRVPSPLQTGPLRLRGLTLPDQTLPAVLAVDPSSSVLYALVRSREAEKLAALQEAKPESPSNEDTDATPPDESQDATSADGAPSPMPPLPSDRAIVRYRFDRWVVDRAGPMDLAVDGQVLAMWANDGVIHLLYQSGDAPGRWISRSLGAPGGDWSEAVPAPVSTPPTIVSASWYQDTPYLLLGKGQGGTVSIEAYTLAGGQWKRTASPVGANGAAARFSPPVTVASTASEIVVATVNDSGVAQVARWSIGDGAPVGDAVTVTPLQGRQKPLTSRGVRITVQYVLLIGVLMIVFLWRRDCLVQPARLMPGQVSASLSRRALALVIDLMVSMPAWVVAVYEMWQGEVGSTSVYEYLAEGARHMPDSMYWSPPVVGLVYGVYAALFEVIKGATAGKLILGLFVVNDQGARPSAGRIVARNAARVVEFMLVPIVLLIVLTPSRQRLGDILARTVVVQHDGIPRGPQPPASRPDADSHGTHADDSGDPAP